MGPSLGWNRPQPHLLGLTRLSRKFFGKLLVLPISLSRKFRGKLQAVPLTVRSVHTRTLESPDITKYLQGVFEQIQIWQPRSFGNLAPRGPLLVTANSTRKDTAVQLELYSTFSFFLLTSIDNNSTVARGARGENLELVRLGTVWTPVFRSGVRGWTPALSRLLG